MQMQQWIQRTQGCICLTQCHCVTGSAVDIPSQAGTNGPPSLMGESPPAGWEGGSELAFPLDDVPKDASAKPSRHGELLLIVRPRCEDGKFSQCACQDLDLSRYGSASLNSGNSLQILGRDTYRRCHSVKPIWVMIQRSAKSICLTEAYGHLGEVRVLMSTLSTTLQFQHCTYTFSTWF